MIGELNVKLQADPDYPIALELCGPLAELSKDDAIKLIADLREVLHRMDATERGTGRTSKQMRDAPHNALFFTREPLGYAMRLAHYLGRSDLNVHPVRLLSHDVRRFGGTSVSAVVVDHAVNLSAEEARGLEWLQPLIRRHA